MTYDEMMEIIYKELNSDGEEKENEEEKEKDFI